MNPHEPAGFEPMGHLTPRPDLEALHDLARGAAARRRAEDGGPPLALEVGTWAGRTALVLAGSFDRVYCVDHWRGNPGDQLGPIAAYLGRDRVFAAFCRNMGDRLFRTVIPCVGSSRCWADAWPAGLALDLVFLDGAHGYTDLVADLLGWRPHVRPGGLVVVHDRDSGFPGVDRALADLMPHARHAGCSLAYEELG